MAERKGKIGLDYWPFDRGFFDDIKIMKLSKHQGGKAPLVYIYLLGRIYGERGYYLLWDDELPFVVSFHLGTGFDEGYVAEVIKACISIGLFDQSMFDAGVLTSASIQRRYIDICTGLRRKSSINEYRLIGLNAEDKPLNDENNGLNDEEMQTMERNGIEMNNPPISDEIVPPSEEEAVSVPVPAKPKTLEERRQEFYDSLIPYVEKYGREMVRDFYNYWSEVSDGGNKMAWEKAKTRKGTFNLSGRLATWKRHQDEGYGSGRSSKRGSTISEAVQAAAIPEGSLAGQLDITKLLGQ